MVQGLAFDFVLVSRRSARRAGTRYLTRGVDESGSVANYVETEQVCAVPLTINTVAASALLNIVALL
jgi:hypothetical protein